MFRGSVNSTGYPLHSPVSPFTSPPVRHRVPSHFNWSLPAFFPVHKCAKLKHTKRNCEMSVYKRITDCVWNLTAHAQKPDFVFRRNGRVHLNLRGASVQSTTGSRGDRISGSNAGYTMFRGSVKSTGYSLHLSVSPSLPLPCVTVCHHISAGV